MIGTKMQIIKNENIRPIDVDGTLICDKLDSDVHVGVHDPVTKRIIRVGVNKNMVRLLLEEKQRGSFIIVWSRGGYEWAKNVLIALDLIEKVDLVMSKPLAYFDDIPVKKWMKDRIFIGPREKYKNG